MGTDAALTDTDWGADDDGGLFVEPTLENGLGDDQTVTIEVWVRAGEETAQEFVAIDLPPNGEGSERVSFDLPAETFDEDGDLDINMHDQGPVPTDEGSDGTKRTWDEQRTE